MAVLFIYGCGEVQRLFVGRTKQSGQIALRDSRNSRVFYGTRLIQWRDEGPRFTSWLGLTLIWLFVTKFSRTGSVLPCVGRGKVKACGEGIKVPGGQAVVVVSRTWLHTRTTNKQTNKHVGS